MRRHHAFVAVLVVVATLSAVVGEASLRTVSDEALARASAAAIRGRVVALTSGWDPAVDTIYTYVTLDVVRSWGLDGAPLQVVVKQLGGVVGDTALVIGGQAHFEVGEEVLVFLDIRPRDRTFSVAELEQGKWTLSGRPELAAAFAREVRGLDPAVVVARDYRDGPSLEALAALAGTRVRASGAILQPRELVEVTSRRPGGAAGPRFSLLVPATPARWHQADTGAPLYVDSQTGGHPQFAGGGLTQLTRAIASWRGAGSLNMQTGVERGPRCFANSEPLDGRISVSYGDPCGEIADDSGSIARGGAYFSSSDVRTVNGVSYWKMVKGMVVTDNVASKFSWMTTGCYEDVLTHEIGHAIGFGHAAARPAMMYPSIDSACTGRTTAMALQADDRSGMAAIYPGAVQVVTVPGAPTGLNVSVAGSTVTIAWAAPSTGSAATSYQLRAGSAPGASDYGGINVAGTTLVVPNVPNGTYYVRVVALNAAGAGASRCHEAAAGHGRCANRVRHRRRTHARRVHLSAAGDRDVVCRRRRRCRHLLRAHRRRERRRRRARHDRGDAGRAPVGRAWVRVPRTLFPCSRAARRVPLALAGSIITEAMGDDSVGPSEVVDEHPVAASDSEIRRRVWRVGVCDAERIADYRRRSLLAVEIPADRTMAVGATAIAAACVERDMAVGDLVVIAECDDPRHPGRLVIGEVLSEAQTRSGLKSMEAIRSVRWHGPGNGEAFDDALCDAVCQVAPFSSLDAALASRIGALAKDAAVFDDDATLLRFEIERRDRVVLPWLPTLFQSPYAERILRDFRWREYLLANPDVAATGQTPAHAFEHFFYQGYYERRIFDPARLDGLDPGYYRARYPELGLASDAEAQIHFCYHGYYDLRVPNADTGWLYDADLHVFQMGKVGSNSIGAAIQDTAYSGHTVHAHWVTDIVSGYQSCRLPYSAILAHPRPQPVRVISGVREIVSWALSGLLHYHGAVMLNADDAVALIEERFWETCLDGLRWFDHGYFCGLDVYAHPFDHAAGCTRITHHPVDLWLYRQEDLPRLEGPLAAFLDLPAVHLPNHNDGEQKGYAELYRRVRRDFRLPVHLLTELYDRPFMRHFYSDGERERSFERWVRRG